MMRGNSLQLYPIAGVDWINLLVVCCWLKHYVTEVLQLSNFTSVALASQLAAIQSIQNLLLIHKMTICSIRCSVLKHCLASYTLNGYFCFQEGNFGQENFGESLAIRQTHQDFLPPKCCIVQYQFYIFKVDIFMDVFVMSHYHWLYNCI